MGYQESMIICRGKKEFDRLCKTLNEGMERLDRGCVYITSIGRLNSEMKLGIPYVPDVDLGTVPSGSYFVWMCGERHPYQSGRNLSPEQKKIFSPSTPYWSSVFCDNILNLKGLLSGIDFEKKGVLQKNEAFTLLEINYGEPIKEEYIKELSQDDIP